MENYTTAEAITKHTRTEKIWCNLSIGFAGFTEEF